MLLPAGVYDASPGKIIGASGVRLVGSGPATVLQIQTGSKLQDYLIDGRGCDHFTVSDLTLDMGGTDPDDGDNGAIVFGGLAGVGGSQCGAARIELINMGRYGIVAKGGTRELRISDSKITRNVAAATPNIGIMFRMDGGTANILARVERNIVGGTCVDVPSWRGMILHNQIRNSGFGGNLVMDDGPNCTGCTIAHNICIGGIGIDIQGMEIWGSAHMIDSNQTHDNAGCGLSIVAPESQILNHSSTGNGASNGAAGITLVRTGTHEPAGAFVNGCHTRYNAAVGLSRNMLTPGIVLGSNDFR